MDEALAHLIAAGGVPFEPVSEVGGGIRMASVKDPAGMVFGIIENPNFVAGHVESGGPGK